jgi:PIG-P
MVVLVVTDKSRQDKSREHYNGPTSPASPLAQFPPLPPASSPSRAPEFYGFVAWAVTYLLFVLYFLWAILPDDWIIWLGVSWYPNRYVSFLFCKTGKKGALPPSPPPLRCWGVLRYR